MFVKSNRSDLSDVIPRLLRYRTYKSRTATYILITGGTGDKVGTGKTALACKIAEMVDPRFSVEYVAYSHRETLACLEKIDKSNFHGRAIVIDESEQIADSKRYMSRLNQLVRYTLATSRVFRPILIFVTPMWADLDSNVRKMMNYWIIPEKVVTAKGLKYCARIYEIKTGLMDGEIILRKLAVSDQSVKGHPRFLHINRLNLDPPSDELWKAVDAKSTEFKRKLRDTMLKELEAEEPEEKDKKAQEEKFSIEAMVDDAMKVGAIREILHRGKTVARADLLMFMPKLNPRFASTVAKLASARFKREFKAKEKVVEKAEAPINET